MAKITLKNDRIIEKKFMKTKEIPLSRIVWAYIQQEDACAALCCGRLGMAVIGRIIAYESDGKKHTLLFDDVKKAEDLLKKMVLSAPGMAAGFTAENREKFSHLIAG